MLFCVRHVARRMADGGRKSRDPRGPKHDATAGTTGDGGRDAEQDSKGGAAAGGNTAEVKRDGLREGAKLRPTESVSAAAASAALCISSWTCAKRGRLRLRGRGPNLPLSQSPLIHH